MKTGDKVPTAWVNSPEADKIAAYYAQGHSTKETMELFGVSKGCLSNLIKSRGISNGRSFRACGDEAGKALKAEAVRRLAEHLNSLGFEYIGGYENRKGHALIRCMTCGAEYERSVSFLHKGNVICIECQKRETKKRQEEQRRKKAQQAEAKALEREWYRRFHPPKEPPKDAYKETHEAFLNRAGVCEICGALYTVRDYVRSCGYKKAQDNGVCSDECRKIKLNREGRASRARRGVRDTHRQRAKKYGGEYDPSVTLKRLIERDGLRCAICGEMCDMNDRSWSEYAGPLYPSIDHIIPMSKGGGHTWDNVQVAHIMCNSLKGVMA